MRSTAAPEVGEPLPRSFFAREPDVVARDLIGRVLVARAPGAGGGIDPGNHAETSILLRLTETEAYHGEQDPASHAYRGPTPRTAVMFGPPGFLYVYFVYGMHWCANIVTGYDGQAAAVLMRAAEVVGNVDAVRERRQSARGAVPPDRDLARGPARLAGCVGLTGDDSGADLCADPSAGHGPGAAPFTVHAGSGARPQVDSGARVGVAAGADTPWRFYDADSRAVSDYRRHRRAPLPRR